MTPEISKEIIRGHTTTIILNILSQGDSYGYEIAKAIRTLSHDAYELNEATLYTAFRRMEKNGEIESYWGDETQGGRRKYYRLTEDGNLTLAQNVANWAFAKNVIDDLITGRIDENGHN
ncbi:PadR family transcriptional regulator [Furfurilactobacillus sp. WILCCON 0119]|uniref:PadR family transcriptional regulator n=1 Tax=Furfurilactobacillus entadae TaxID=2922307 RepID=UPI0035EBFDD8